MKNSTTIAIVIIINFIYVHSLHAQNTINHPKRSNVPYINKLRLNKVFKNASHLSSSSQKKISNLQETINKAHELYQIGERDGEKEELLGRVVGTVSDSQGNTYVLDSRKNHITVYDSLGNFNYTFGKGGPGPGEFRSPVDIEIDADDNIYIADRYNAIKKFVLSNGTYSYKTTFIIHIVPNAFCILNNSLYVRGVGIDKSSSNSKAFKIIHKYSLKDGGYITSFGKPYKAKSILATKQLSDGLIACDDESNTVITTYDLMPYLFGFNNMGEIKWVSKINLFSQRPILEKNNNGQSTITLKGSDYSDSIEGIHTMDGEFFILQTVGRPGGRNIDPSKIQINTFSISANNGDGTRLNISYPNLFVANITDGRLFFNGLLKNHYPSLLVYDY